MKKTIGKIIRKAREDIGFSIETISQETKIKTEYIEAIENDDYSIFSSHVHAKGFIQNIAKFLGLNHESLIAMYRRDHEIQGYSRLSSPTLVKSEEQIIEKKRLDFDIKFLLSSKKIILAATLIFFLIIGFITYSLFISAFSNPYLEVTSPVEIEADYDGKIEYAGDEIIISGKTESGASIKINQEPIALENNLTFKSKRIFLIDDENIITIVASNNLGVESKIELRVVKQEPVINDMNIIVQVNNTDTDLVLKADREIKHNDIFKSGDSVNLTAKTSFEIITSIPENITIFINNQEYRLNSTETKFENTGKEIRKI